MKDIRLSLLLVLLASCGRAETEGIIVLPYWGSDDRVLFFFDAHCPDCRLVKDELLSPLLEKHAIPGADVIYVNVAAPATAELLRQLESTLGFEASVIAPILVIGRQAYCGVAQIEEALASETDLGSPTSEGRAASKDDDFSISDFSLHGPNEPGIMPNSPSTVHEGRGAHDKQGWRAAIDDGGMLMEAEP